MTPNYMCFLEVRVVDGDLHEVLGQQISPELWGRLALSCSYSSKVWLVGDRLTSREQEKAELGCNRIPTGPTLKGLDMCFLTFHCLATPSKDSHPTTPACPGFEGIGHFTTATGRLSLPAFGLASYKLRSSLWASNGAPEQESVMSLMQEADNWLRYVQVLFCAGCSHEEKLRLQDALLLSSTP
ncbi:uncharacterized protein LOC125554213 isoform X2 [Triticum urartu]|uniref:uncharacterized protein LOC125554213 isoform X2 n=1 Tax=Triticum urartu TaxID=4572 RepID=UPI00204412CA|nr:uncharacterized protein LOC125554213 isoform X2 [Triticum urartu]